MRHAGWKASARKAAPRTQTNALAAVKRPSAAWRAQNGLDCNIGLARNARLHRMEANAMRKVAAEHKRPGEAARAFTSHGFRPHKSRSHSRRAITKSGQIQGRESLPMR